MAARNIGGSNYSDDDLDELDIGTLAELEQNAIQLTQKAGHIKAAPSSDYGDFDNDDLDDAVLIDEARSAPAVAQVISRTVQGPTTQREQFRTQRYGDQIPQIASRPRDKLPPPPRWQHPKGVAQASQTQNESLVVRQGSHPSADQVESLQKQIEELMNERNLLKQDLNSKAGEIAIVRSKSEKQAKETERELTAVKKLHADQLAKKQQEIEAIRIAEKNAKTDLDFTRQDLAEEVERVRRLNKSKAAEKKDGTIMTPKKKKALAHRDGFDDEDVELLSPSKILSPSKRHKHATASPSKAGAKRKRKAVDSPAAGALEMVQADEPPVDILEAARPKIDEAMLENLGRQDDRLDFLGNMLDHRSRRGQPRIIEELGKHILPSSPSESFQSQILGAIPTLGIKKPVSSLPIDFCELLISMWSQCINENYLKPISLFIDMLTYALELKTQAIAPHIIKNLVPLALRTADLVAIPRFNRKPPDSYDKDVDVSACLSIVHLATLGCMSRLDHITHFWKLMRWDFVLMMLSQNQPTEHYEMMLRILSTGILRDSFGTIQEDIESDFSKAQNVGYIIERLTWPLFEVPYLPMSTDKVDAETLSHLRLKIIELLINMTLSPYAGKAFAEHPKAIGRLVSFMSDELDVLYDHNFRHEESAHLITLSARLLYHLVTRYESLIDMPTKLLPIRGGSQKYLLVLARLNFSDDEGVLERGIGEDVQGYALELLDGAVTPEEAEGVEGAFVSQR